MDELSPAESLLQKVRRFVNQDLDDDERQLFATLIAPGVASAIDGGDDEVHGFGLVAWDPGTVPQALRDALAAHPITIVDIDP